MDNSTHDLSNLENEVEALSTALNMGEDLLDATTADAFNLNASARTKRRSKREKYRSRAVKGSAIEVSDSESESVSDNSELESNANKEDRAKKSRKVAHALKKLQASFNPEAT